MACCRGSGIFTIARTSKAINIKPPLSGLCGATKVSLNARQSLQGQPPWALICLGVNLLVGTAALILA
ncbi:hypothetical protein PLICRDRAFT_33679 [Plicaturopsis crispa FD-325 SS-3]|nr:hypothetical protein PLICRDRAFT_33679 [Plicaturopsis crispa FD-325 SS-3]